MRFHSLCSFHSLCKSSYIWGWGSYTRRSEPKCLSLRPKCGDWLGGDSCTAALEMAEDAAHQTIMELKAKFDDNNGKLKQVGQVELRG